MIRISLSDAEKAAGRLDEENLAAAMAAIADDGVVVLQQAVPHGPLDKLRVRMDADTRELQAFHAAHSGNPRTPGQLQQGPPPTVDFVFPEVSANPFAIQLSKAVLGEHCYLNFYNGNTNCPGSEYQQVHWDNPHLWPNNPVASPTYSLVINISPSDCTLQNGAVEVWPGTHMINAACDDNNILPQVLEMRRKVCPPIQAETQKGDILIRDARLWHRGVPNYSDRPRHMIAFVYIAGWHRRVRTIPFQKGCEKIFENVDFDFNAEYVDKKIDYLLGPTKRAYKLGIVKD